MNVPESADHEKIDASIPGNDEHLPSPSTVSVADWKAGLWLAIPLAVTCIWAYWPTGAWLVEQWDSQPDYSHGFLVPPLALFLLWTRRSSTPPLTGRVAWFGLSLIAVSVFVRWVGARAYLESADGWSIPFWVAGCCWVLGGWRFCLWTLPGVFFLFFMVPLPYRVETALSLPLQGIATDISCWMLQSLGQPALAEGNTIILGEHQLEVAQACSGLRMFTGIVALAYAYVVIVRRPLWEKAFLMVSVVPIALLVNGIRITATGILYQFASGEAAQKFSHDAAGWVMILLSAALFKLVLMYLSWLLVDVQVDDQKELLRAAAT